MLLEAFIIISFASSRTPVFGSSVSEPRNVTVTSLESNRLNITWKIPLITNNKALSYTVFYKSSLKVENYWNESRDIVGFEASLHVKPHRKYEIFVMAKSNASYGVPSVRITSSLTPSAAPDSCPIIQDFEYRSATPIGIQWNPVPEQDQNGKITGHLIYYKNCSGDWRVADNVTVDKAEDYGDIANISAGLYLFKVVAYNAIGFCKGHETLPGVSQLFRKCSCPTTPSVPPSQSPSSTVAVKPVTSTETIIIPSVLPSQSPTPTMAVKPATPTEKTTISSALPSQSPTSTMAVKPAVTPTEKTTIPPTEKQQITHQPCPTHSKEPTEQNTEKPAEKLASTKDSKWLLYVTIALGVLVVILGTAIFFLTWLLHKNHRFYKLKEREHQYKMSSRTDSRHDNRAQENLYVTTGED